MGLVVNFIVELSAPDDHFGSGPNGRVLGTRSGRAACGGGNPGISARIVPPPSIDLVEMHIIIDVASAPNNHFLASPNGRVPHTPAWRGSCTGRNPIV